MIMHLIESFLIFIYCSVFIAAYNCSENCAIPQSNNTDTCDILTGTCSFGCKQGFAENNCSFVCPEKCGIPDGFNTETCNCSTGACLHGCQYGYTGSDCSIRCPENCTGPPDGNNSVVCDAISMQCLFGCKNGYYGPLCTQICDTQISDYINCSQKTNTSEVICTECNKSSYIENNYCKPCSYWCASLPGTPLCNKYNGFCSNGCNRSRYCGNTCLTSCNDGCLNKICDRSCVCSQGCSSNTWGSICTNVCSQNCYNGTCDRTNGTCIHGCVSNTPWDSQCSSKCSQSCFNGTCDRWSGICDGYINNKVYGIGCDRECSSNCINNSCRRQDGFCEEGCISGWYGAQCDHRCSVHCIGESCERQAGTCNCGTGRFGTKCEFQCQETCVNKTCHPVSGICTYGYDGGKCDKVISNSPISRAEIGIAIREGVMFLMLVTVIIYLVMKSDACKGVRNKALRRSDITENVVRGNRDTHVYTDLNRTNDAEGTTGPYDALDMKTTANTKVSTPNPAHTVKETSSSYELM